MGRVRQVALLVALVLSANVATAAPKGDKVAAAKKLYDAKRYPEALAACDKALANPKLAKPARVECLKIQAFALFLLSQSENARKTWLELLKIFPTYKIDPVMVSPEFVSFFGRITPAEIDAPPPPAAPPAPTPEATAPPPETAPTPTTPAPPDESPDSTEAMEPMPRTLPASAPATGTGPAPTSTPGASPSSSAGAEGGETHEIVAAASFDGAGRSGTPTSTAVSPALSRPCGVFLCMLPFGVGQFVNGEPVKGALFAAGEVGFLATNLALYWARVGEYNTYGYLKNPDGAQTSFVIQHVALGLFAAALVGGVVDAFLFGP